jgi:hypothetical protein
MGNKVIEVCMGVGLNMIFPEPLIIEIPDNEDVKVAYERYLQFIKKMEEPDYEYVFDDPNQNMVRELTFEEFVFEYDSNVNFQEKFGVEEEVVKPKKRGRKKKSE